MRFVAAVSFMSPTLPPAIATIGKHVPATQGVERLREEGLRTIRDIQRLPTAPFSLVLRKEYFDCPQRDSHAVHYCTINRGGRGEPVLLQL